jgi:hypothetical protein
MEVNTHRLDLVVCVVHLSPEESGVRADIERPAIKLQEAKSFLFIRVLL